MGNNPPLNRPEVTAPTGSPDDALAPGIPGGFPGNQNDDDAQATDDYFEAAYQGPEEYMGVIPPVAELPSATRLVSWKRYLPSLSATNPQAVMALPTDPNRKSLVIHAYSTGDVGFLAVASEPFSAPGNIAGDPINLQPLLNASIFNLGQIDISIPATNVFTLVLDNHTGSLWVAALVPSDTSFSVACSVLAVTC